METIQQKERLIELRAEGFSFQAIATELGVTKKTVINWATDLETEIQNFRAVALDALYEKHFMSKKSRIELLSEQLAKVKNELSKRNFEDIPSDKLLDIHLKLLSAMKDEKDRLTLTAEHSTLDIDFTNYEKCSIDN